MAAAFRDYYEVLGLPRTANDADIKKAYYKLAREHHPDLHAASEKDLHTKRMQEVNEAYSVLSSKDDRAKYDQFGQHWKEGAAPPPPRPQYENAGTGPSRQGGSDEGFSDFFRDMFRGGGASAAGGFGESSAAELDIEAVLELSLIDALNGAERSFSLATTGLCSNCRGTGRKGKAICSVCGGVGEVRRQRDVTTKIPAGLLDGARIRLKGQGNEGPAGRGDLYLQIRLAPDARFHVDGKNLETRVRVMPWIAALGLEASVDTIEGEVRMRVPKGTKAGTRLRLAGKGLGKPTDRGDLFARIDIDIPTNITPKAEALWKQLEEESHV